MEGGINPWRVQRIENNSIDLDAYGKPLPPPPQGFYWERQEDRSWELKKYDSETVGGIVFKQPSVIEHVMMPGETIMGLCLKYRVSATELRRFNNFSGNKIAMATLRIPIEHQMPIQTQSETHEVMIQRFKNLTQENASEARYYLEESEWNFQAAHQTWEEDAKWAAADRPAHPLQQTNDLPADPSEHYQEDPFGGQNSRERSFFGRLARLGRKLPSADAEMGTDVIVMPAAVVVADDGRSRSSSMASTNADRRITTAVAIFSPSLSSSSSFTSATAIPTVASRNSPLAAFKRTASLGGSTSLFSSIFRSSSSPSSSSLSTQESSTSLSLSRPEGRLLVPLLGGSRSLPASAVKS